MVLGVAGVGKSALLDFAAGAAGGAVVLRARGSGAESDVPFAGLADLVRGRLEVLDQMPARQARALRVALGVEQGSGVDAAGVFAAALGFFSTAAESAPVVAVVDDAQWLDRDSLRVLSFTARRLDRDRVVMLFGVRSSDGRVPAELDGLTRLPVRGLDPGAARELLAAHGGARFTESEVDRFVAESAGNPLALTQLPLLLDEEARTRWLHSAEPLPVHEVLVRAFGDLVGRLAGRSREALVRLAVLGAAPASQVRAALAAGGLGVDDLEEPSRAGLVVERAGLLDFGHPLMRSAVYQLATATQRLRAHEAAAGALAGNSALDALERRGWHVVAAGSGADDGFADLLEDAAGSAAFGGRFALAARLLERSAELTGLPDRRAERLLRAAEVAPVGGRLEDAERLCARAIEGAVDPRVLVAVRHYRLALLTWRGDPLGGRDGLIALSRDPHVGPQTAAHALSDAALTNIVVGRFVEAGELSARAAALVLDDGGVVIPVHLIRAFALAVVGRLDEARPLLAACDPLVDELDPLDLNQVPLVSALAHFAVEDIDRARVILGRSIGAARSAGAVGLLAFQLSRLSQVQLWQGVCLGARASANEAAQLARDSGWSTELPAALVHIALAEARTGRAEQCRAHAAEAVTMAGDRLLPVAAGASSALASLALARAQYGEAVIRLGDVARFGRESGGGDQVLMPWAADLAEALARTGSHADVEEALSALGLAASQGRVSAAAGLARCRAFLEPRRAEVHLEEAIELYGRVGARFEQARTRLYLGEAHRRRGRRVDARRVLSTALEEFTATGAVDWGRRVERELRAAGAQPAPEGRGAVATLTPQELQVALAAVEGQSNQEVAQGLFLSVKTVEFHLSNTYRKLGIQRRSQLAHVLPAPATPSVP